MTCGIYCITNNVNGMKYVGQSVCIEKRFIQHIESESTSKIHEAIVKYGVKNFRFEIIVECLPEELDEQERKLIRLTDSYNNGYNQTPGGQHRVFNVEYEYGRYTQMEENNRSLRDKLKKKDELIASLNKELKRLELKLTDLEEESLKLTSRNEFLEKNKKYFEDKKNTEIRRLKRKIQDLENGTDSSVKKLKQRVESLEGENYELNSLVENLCLHQTKNKSKESNIFHKIVSENNAAESI